MAEHNSLMTKLKIGDEEIEVPLYFEMNGFLPAVMAQHMAIQGTPDNIIVSFYEANPPIVFEPSPEAIERLKQEGYTAECVARIAIPNSRFKDFANIFAQVAGLRADKESDKPDGDNQ